MSGRGRGGGAGERSGEEGLWAADTGAVALAAWITENRKWMMENRE
jgi:hypothetical protein